MLPTPSCLHDKKNMQGHELGEVRYPIVLARVIERIPGHYIKKNAFASLKGPFLNYPTTTYLVFNACLLLFPSLGQLMLGGKDSLLG